MDEPKVLSGDGHQLHVGMPVWWFEAIGLEADAQLRRGFVHSLELNRILIRVDEISGPVFEYYCSHDSVMARLFTRRHTALCRRARELDIALQATLKAILEPEDDGPALQAAIEAATQWSNANRRPLP